MQILTMARGWEKVIINSFCARSENFRDLFGTHKVENFLIKITSLGKRHSQRHCKRRFCRGSK